MGVTGQVDSRRGHLVGGATAVAALGVGIGLVAASLSPLVSQGSVSQPVHVDSALTGNDNDVATLIDQYCVRCHNERRMVANLALDVVDPSNPAANPEIWERVVKRLETRTMPPLRNDAQRPNPTTYRESAEWLAAEIDSAYAADPDPNPGRIASVHRLNRTEYNNAINDLLGLEIDVRGQLPGDETADGGFDNVAEALTISPLHMERYLSVSRQVTRLATGIPPIAPDSKRYLVDDKKSQDIWMSEDLPLGSRGGIAINHHFPVDGDYTISVRLRKNYAGYVRGMGWQQELDVRLDRGLLKRFTVGGGARARRPAPNSYGGAGGGPGWAGSPEWEEYMLSVADTDLTVTTHVGAGQREVGLSFTRDVWIDENVLPQPPVQVKGQLDAFNEDYMGYAGVLEVYIDGPHESGSIARGTTSRDLIFTCQPETAADEPSCAYEILSVMARKAFRRPVRDEEIQMLMGFYELGKETGGTFDHGVQLGLERILIDPDFLLRTYRDTRSDTSRHGGSYPLSDLELASRLSFFLWSNLPDDELIGLAETGRLTDPSVLMDQVNRMLADDRAHGALVDGFASQWLNLRLLDEQVRHDDIYFEWDHNLKEAAEQETTLFIESTIREDRSVLDLLSADYSYLNERLARHYGIPHVAGSHFRRVQFPDLKERGGLLGHASLLTVTSYPDRTSPVLRGKWILENLLGVSAPPPPPDVDTSLEPTEENSPGKMRSMRERLEQHRSNPSCASCHAMLDPLGFALESFDATGGHRTVDEHGNAVDDRGATLSGEEVTGLAGLRAMLLADEKQFVLTVTEKLMAYALGRDLEYYDRPALRKIVGEAQHEAYRWSSIIEGIVKSPQFLRRTSLAHELR